MAWYRVYLGPAKEPKKRSRRGRAAESGEPASSESARAFWGL